MGEHKAFIANGVYPYFNSTPRRYRNFTARAGRIADAVRASGADCATFGELGKAECLALASRLQGWQYDRAQGVGSGLWQQGINSSWSDTAAWVQPDPGPGYNMPSGGQTPPRTLMLAKITEKNDPTASLTLGAFHETLGNAAGLAYVKAMVSKIGNRTPVLLGGDFKRTADRDDLAYMKAHGLEVHERVSYTPMACFTKGDITVTDVDHRSDSKCFDHGYLVVTFIIPSQPVIQPEASL